ncbi:N-6 DNA methylase [Sphingobium sp. SA2]|uniref:N-6 DNA methylase n=1 Tax=Sphingobium sp. SA2 TaxID=1524832 RepID=UPI0028C2FA9E|nr:N-6 DNA methylase [Sphingobium sp. SA2]MDT7532114.1 N-6 DNA methylase [Sphingobium sp. SA2]
MAVAVYNERSWAIDLIGYLKGIAHNEVRTVRDVSGEQTITDLSGSLFPDVLLFGDRDTARILQGWELKLPDTDIADQDFFDNAELKARMLGLDSFVLWNVRYARLYALDRDADEFVLHTEWTDLRDIVTRSAVRAARTRWETLGAEILQTMNALFADGSLEGRQFIDAYRSGGPSNLILANEGLVAEALEAAAKKDGTFRAEVTLWWDRHQNEYDGDNRFAALARANLMNWTGKFLFAHVLRERDDRAGPVATISTEMSPSDALGVFQDISNQCNFWTVFCDTLGLSVLPSQSWEQLCQFNRLLSDLRLGSVDQTQISTILEAAASVGDRKLRGQYTTPAPLAKLVVRLGINDLADRVLDPCCGSGTIIRAALDAKLAGGISGAEAASQICASDIDRQAVQLATFSLSTPTLARQPLRVFALDAFKLRPTLGIEFRDPNDGSLIKETVGSFACIASNLPFVAQDGRRAYGDATASVNTLLEKDGEGLPGRSDVSAYLPFVFYDLLKARGRVVIIIPNAWLGTAWGQAFYDRLIAFYHLRAVITSGAGRWFSNSDVVTNVLVLEKRAADDESRSDTKFVILKQPVDLLADDAHVDSVAAQIEIGSAQEDVMSIRSVSHDQLIKARPYGLAGSAQFVDVDWLLDCPLVPVRTLFTIRRGERRGWDKLFYPAKGHGIEADYIEPVLKSSTKIETYEAKADGEAFCCSLSESQLRKLGHTGALDWIKRFKTVRNGTGDPLPDVLAKAGHQWYEMRADRVAELVIPLAYGKRLYVGRVNPASFVNQRLMGMNAHANVNVDLAHALLNCTIGLLMIEGIGFGRGLGALDLNKDRIEANLHMLDPEKLTKVQRSEIIAAFKTVKKRKILEVSDELDQSDRHNLDDAVIKNFGIKVPRETIYDALRALVEVRHAIEF